MTLTLLYDLDFGLVFRNMGPNTRWLLEPENSTGVIQSMDNYDITGDGVKDLIIGRHDGNIEVYAYDEGDDSEPVLKYSHVSFKITTFKKCFSYNFPTRTRPQPVQIVHFFVLDKVVCWKVCLMVCF
jgi:hypothetical protein